VLRDEVLHYLRPKPGGVYLDGTVGLGGHSEAIMEAAQGGAQLLGLDRDARALRIAGERLGRFGERVALVHTAYSGFADALREKGWDEPGKLDGVLLDVGVSSMQLDDPERGFSFLQDGPLDMRMDPGGGMAPASAIVNRTGFEELKRIIWEYGEDPMAGRIARSIINARNEEPIETTLRLARIVEKAYPPKMRATARNHPATRTFQALRVAVNGELDELRSFLRDVVPHVAVGGRIAVISFHSLEDRIVKRFFRDEAKGCVCPREIPVCICGRTPTLKVLTKKPVVPGEAEIAANPRARSSKLRVAERVAQPAA
jgi:16S rRNA (cytosine1402-N4)-methyltransferase